MRGYNFYPNDASDLLNWFCPQPNYDHLSGDELNELFKTVAYYEGPPERLSYYWRLGNWGTKKINWTFNARPPNGRYGSALLQLTHLPWPLTRLQSTIMGLNLKPVMTRRIFGIRVRLVRTFMSISITTTRGFQRIFGKYWINLRVGFNGKNGKVLESQK